MQYLYPMYMTEVPQTTVWDLVNVNVGATTHMTKLVLPGMQERKRGAIVNVSSSAELQPMPLLAVYAATKVTRTFYNITVDILMVRPKGGVGSRVRDPKWKSLINVFQR